MLEVLCVEEGKQVEFWWHYFSHVSVYFTTEVSQKRSSDHSEDAICFSKGPGLTQCPKKDHFKAFLGLGKQ